MADEYACFVSEFDCSDQKCQKLSFQSWQVLLQVNPLCENYRFYKHWLEHERYLKTIWLLERVKLTYFRCSSAALPTGKWWYGNPWSKLWGSHSVKDEYNLVLNCSSVSAKQQQFLPIHYFTHSYLIESEQLMNPKWPPTSWITLS